MHRPVMSESTRRISATETELSEERRAFLSSSHSGSPDVESQEEPPAQLTMKPVQANSYQSTTSSYIRIGLLIALCLQNSMYSLLRRWAVAIKAKGESQPSDSSLLIGGECMKLAVSLFMVSVPTRVATTSTTDLVSTAAGGSRSSASGVMQHLLNVMRLSPKMLVPAMVYYLMNRLSFVALRRIDAATFTVCAQLKTATTALFSFAILGRRFSGPRIRALVHMVCSVIVISEFAATHSTGRKVEQEFELNHFLVGLAAVLTEVTLSGAISVYYEKVLKDDIIKSGLSVWDRNIQLAVFSIAMYFPTFITDGYFEHWTPVTILISFLGAAGGLMVAFSMKYADAILKALATSGAIVLTAFGGALWLNAPFGIPIVASSVSVVVAILTYVTDGGIFSNLCLDSSASRS